MAKLEILLRTTLNSNDVRITVFMVKRLGVKQRIYGASYVSGEPTDEDICAMIEPRLDDRPWHYLIEWDYAQTHGIIKMSDKAYAESRFWKLVNAINKNKIQFRHESNPIVGKDR